MFTYLYIYSSIIAIIAQQLEMWQPRHRWTKHLQGSHSPHSATSLGPCKELYLKRMSVATTDHWLPHKDAQDTKDE